MVQQGLIFLTPFEQLPISDKKIASLEVGEWVKTYFPHFLNPAAGVAFARL